MKIKLYQIEAFTNKLFKDNPAAVCPLNIWLDDEVILVKLTNSIL